MNYQERSGTYSQTILPQKTPDGIKLMVPIACKSSPELLRKILKVSLKDIEGGTISEDAFANFKVSSDLEEDKFVALYTGVLLLLKQILQHPVNSIKKEALCSELSELRIPNGLIEDICYIVFGERRQTIDQIKLDSQPQLPSLDSFRWRVDVTISTSVLNRVLEPTILMELGNSEAAKSTFEVSQSKFHELRYNVAYLLKEMENIEKRLP